MLLSTRSTISLHVRAWVPAPPHLAHKADPERGCEAMRRLRVGSAAERTGSRVACRAMCGCDDDDFGVVGIQKKKRAVG